MNRIFLFDDRGLILVALSYWLIISIIQFKNEAKEYHQNERKENAGEHINYVLHQLSDESKFRFNFQVINSMRLVFTKRYNIKY
jgi:hypothetical protein